jgi:hypothetical protein
MLGAEALVGLAAYGDSSGSDADEEEEGEGSRLRAVGGHAERHQHAKPERNP